MTKVEEGEFLRISVNHSSRPFGLEDISEKYEPTMG